MECLWARPGNPYSSAAHGRILSFVLFVISTARRECGEVWNEDGHEQNFFYPDTVRDDLADLEHISTDPARLDWGCWRSPEPRALRAPSARRVPAAAEAAEEAGCMGQRAPESRSSTSLRGPI